MKKRGQVTIFIIIALVVIVIGIGIYSFYPETKCEDSPPEIGEINNFVIDCLEFKCLNYKLVCCEEYPTYSNY